MIPTPRAAAWAARSSPCMGRRSATTTWATPMLRRFLRGWSGVRRCWRVTLRPPGWAGASAAAELVLSHQPSAARTFPRRVIVGLLPVVPEAVRDAAGRGPHSVVAVPADPAVTGSMPTACQSRATGGYPRGDSVR